MIRFKIDVLEALKEKGYTTNIIRNDRILSEATLQQIRISLKDNSNVKLNTKTINVLCKILKKQPGQILEYIPDDKTTGSHKKQIRT